MRRRAARPRPVTAEGFGPADMVTVVIGSDGSPTSWDAFCWGCGEARRLGGRAVAVFTAPDPTEQLRAEILQQTVDQGIDLTFIHAHGDPATELLRVAEAVRADMIVVGKSTKARHRLVGSIGARLIAKRPAPVVVIVP